MKKAIDSIRNWYMNVSAMTWMWVGATTIVISNVLQLLALYFPSLTLALVTIGLALNTVSVPFTIVQAYRSARDFKQEQKRTDAEIQKYSGLSKLKVPMKLDIAPNSMPDSHQ